MTSHKFGHFSTPLPLHALCITSKCHTLPYPPTPSLRDVIYDTTFTGLNSACSFFTDPGQLPPELEGTWPNLDGVGAKAHLWDRQRWRGKYHSSRCCCHNLLSRGKLWSCSQVQFPTVVVCCCKLNNARVCDEHLFGQVSTPTGDNSTGWSYQVTLWIKCT